jgi:hypothetical protein
MQDSSLLHYFFSYLADFDVVMRKLISEQQALSQRFLITLMYRISSPIDFEDIVIMREAAICRDPIFHETPHHSPPRN